MTDNPSPRAAAALSPPGLPTPKNLRRILPLLSTAVALAVTGCAAPAPTPPQQTARKLSDFTTGMDSAIDQADPAKLRAASEGRPLPPKPINPTLADAPPDPTATPAPHPLRKPLTDLSTAPVASVTPNHISGVPSLLGQVDNPPTQSAPPTPPAPTPDAQGLHPLVTPSPAPGIQPATPTTQPATQPAPVAIPPAAAPVALPPPPLAPPTVEQALAVLQRQAADHPSLNTTLALALLTTAQGKAPDTVAAANLAPADQKIFTDLLTAFQSMTAPASPGATVAERAAPLLDAAKKWQVANDLTLPKLALASRVDSFGVFTPVDAKFPAGSRHTVIIYCEVANFSSKKTDDGWFETHLSQQDTLITDDGLLIWRPTAEEVEDRSMNQRRDFYLVKKLTIPDNLAAGKYTLRMSVTDKNSGKFAMTNIPVEITPANP